MSFPRSLGTAVTVGLIGFLAACGNSTAGVMPPQPTRTIDSEGTLTIPVATSKSLDELVRKPGLVTWVAQGQILTVQSSVNVDDEVESTLQLKQLDGTVATFRMDGGTVRARDLKTVTDPPIGPVPSTEAELDAPVTETYFGVVVPAPGDDVIVLGALRSDTEKLPTVRVVLELVHSASGTKYAFSGRPLVDGWKPPASASEAAALVEAVQSR